MHHSFSKNREILFIFIRNQQILFATFITHHLSKMASAIVSKNENIDEINFIFHVSNVNELKSFRSKVFFVNGNPFTIEAKRIVTSPTLSFLGILLHSEIKNVAFDWAVVSSFSAELISNDFRQAPKVEHFEPTSFHGDCFKSDNCRLVTWTELIDPEKSFIKDDSLRMRIKIKSTPLQDTTNDGWCQMESIENCCDSCSFGKFRVTVNKFDEHGICSPKLVVNNMSWRAQINITDGDTDQRHLRIKLFNNTCSMLTVVNCQAKITCKLLSFDAATEPKESKLEHKFTFMERSLVCNIASWVELIDKEKQFIRNDAFIVELDIRVLETNNLTRKRKAIGGIDEGMSIGCPICFASLMNRDMSSLPCGHIYCLACISAHLATKKFCPLCNAVSSVRHLRRVHLPLLKNSCA